MAMTTPTCGHVQPIDAVIPDWQCPACVVRYAGFERRAAAPSHAARSALAGPRRSLAPGIMSKVLLLAALAWGLNQGIRHRQGLGSDAVAGLPAATLRMPQAEAILLRSMPDRVEAACERTKDAPSQQECRARLHERGGACVAQVAQAYPREAREIDRMAVIVHAYQDCVFGTWPRQTGPVPNRPV